VRELYPVMGRACAARVGHPAYSTAKMARRLKVRRAPDARTWSHEDKAFLRNHYPAMGVAKCAALLGRKEWAVAAMAKKLSLRLGRTWTPRQETLLEAHWHRKTPDELVKILAPHPWPGILTKARHLGLRLTMPEDAELVAHAAKRLGYSLMAFAKLLRRQGVKTHYCYPSRGAGLKLRRRYVMTAEADEAVRTELASETVREASKRIRVAYATLWRLVQAAGFATARGQRLGLPPAVFDRLVAEWKEKRAAESKRAASAQRREQRKRVARGDGAKVLVSGVPGPGGGAPG
jgi:hypothetical protein